MKVTGVILYCITFLAYGVLFSNSYTKISFSYKAWVAVTAAATLMLAAELVYENFIQKQ